MCKLYTGIGRQHAYWQLARWFGDLGIGRHPWGWRPARRPPSDVTTVPLGGSLDGSVRRSLFRRLRSDAVRRRTHSQDDRRQGRRAQGTERVRPRSTARTSASTSRAGIPSRSRAPRSPTRSRPAFVQVGQSTKKPWNFYYWPTKADSIHEPWAGGNGRVDTMIPCARRRRADSPRRGLHSARRGYRPGRAATACSKRCLRPATTRPGSPTFMMT